MIGSVAATDTVSMNTALRRALMLGVSTLSLGLSPAAWAQDVPSQTGQAAEEAAGEEQDIVVTGLRASLQSAQAIKQNADQFVDSITAIDIGKLPDKNVAETLQRISGIQITRNRGEGSGIAIRGLTQVRTEINGRDAFSGSGGRSLSFEDVPSELLAGVDVYKNPSAELIEGGIGGTVNLRTRMPFDERGNDWLVAVTMGANNYDLVDDTKFNASGLVSKRWNTGIGDIGILFDASYFGGAFRTDELVVEPYRSTTAIDGTSRSVPVGAGIGVTYGERERKGYYGALQWAPNEDLEFYATGLRSEYYIETPNYTSFVTRGTDAIGLAGLAPLPGFQFDEDGVFQSGGFSGFIPDWSIDPYDNRNQLNVASNSQVSYNQSATTDFAGGMKWKINDRLRLNVDLQYVKANFENRSYTAFAQRDLASYAIGLAGDMPQITFGGLPGSAPLSAINTYRVTALMDRKENSDAEQKTARADLTWDFEESFLKSISVGGRVTDRSAINRATPYSWSGAVGTAGLDDSRFNAINNPYAGDFFHGDNTSVGNVPFVGMSVLNESNVAGLFQSVVGRGLTDYGPQDINTQEEQTYAGYVMARFEAGPIDGNIGVRVIKTHSEALGSFRLTYRPNLLPGPDPLTVDQEFSGDQDYTKVLPTLNVRAHITDTLQARFAAGKAMSRPAFYDLRAIRSLSLSYTQVTDAATGAVLGYRQNDNQTGSGGNPFLKPEESKQLDAALEWYAKPGTLLYGTVFYKDLTNFIYDSVFPVTYDVPGQGAVTFQNTGRLNGTNGSVKGFEIGGNTFFDFLPGALSGFGVQANLTYADSDAPGSGGTLQDGESVSTPLQGLSKWSYNLIGMYEKYGFTARAAYNWRDDYLETVAGNGTGGVPIYRKAYGQLDASISYDFSPKVSLTIDAVNLLRQRQESYQNVETNPRFIRLEDRRVGLTFRIRN
ncbi:TonB-dependent receptor [Sphingomonas xinjiangensis]|uniref:TonB-dependent receptor n=1 Tax=Sphingomonas xinjiangensis TaxID=643568 RepID=A0A840YS87_9SPHN|nr:TonB-dependent receptor [Sphingomonas xinjiangensis]MBB5712551.1 TonB-dependent receptor [Sphingomonas xinjiangensis]